MNDKQQFRGVTCRKFRASAMNGEQQHRGFASPTVNCKFGSDCHGLIAWVSGKDCWAGLEREREREREREKKKTETSRKKKKKK
jgi:hypothetical protein